MKKFTVPYKSEVIAAIIVLVFFVAVKNRFQYVKTGIDAIEAGKRAVEEHKSLAGRWESADKDFKTAMEGFLLKGPVEFKNIIQDKAWSNDINLVDIRANQDLSGILGMGSLDLVITGKFINIVKFVQVLEENNIRIAYFSVKGSDKKKDFVIKVYCYFSKSGENG